MLWSMLSLALISSQVKVKISSAWVLILLATQLLATLIISPNINERAVGTLGEPNSLSAFVIFSWPFIYFGSKKPLKVAGFAGVLILLILAGSRSGFIAFCIQSLFLFLTSLKRFSLKISLIAAISLIAVTLSFPFIEGGGWYENRAEIWQTAWFAGWLNPIFGSGFGNIENTLKQSSVWLGNNVKYQFVDSAHNFMLDFWVQGGVVVSGTILFLMYLTLKNYLKSQDVFKLTLTLGIITVMLFNPVSVVVLIYFWWLIGASFLKDKIS